MDVYFASHKSLNLLNDDAHKVFKRLVEEIDMPLFMADERKNIFYGNPAFKKLWPLDVGDHLMGSNWLYLMLPDPLARARFVDILEEQGYIKDFELHIKSPHEKQQDFLFSVKLIRDDQGNVIGMRGTLLDITQRSLLENALRIEHERLSQVLDLCNTIGGFDDDAQLARYVIEQISAILGAERCSLMCIDAVRNELYIKAAKGMDEELQQAVRVRIGTPVCGLIALRGKAVLVEDIEKNDIVHQKHHPRYGSRSFMSAPIIIDQKVVGLLNVSGRNEPFTMLDLKVLESVALQASINLRKVQTVSTLSTLSQTDAHTSLRNYRAFAQMLGEEIRRAQRYNRPFSLVMLDVDHFKQYNDRKGHLAGDALLRRLASTFTQNFRASDHVFRYGGDEFAVILPETTVEHAAIAAENVRDIVEKEFFTANVTLSIGIAEYEENDTAEKLLQKADVLLYNSKNLGRNRISKSRLTVAEIRRV